MPNDKAGCPSPNAQETPARILSRADINGKFTARQYALVHIEDLGTIRIQSLTNREHYQLRNWLNAEDDETAKQRWNNIHAAMIAWCAVDEEGKRLFRTSEADAGTFDDWQGKTVTALGEACEQLTGFLAKAYTVEAVEDEIKN